MRAQIALEFRNRDRAGVEDAGGQRCIDVGLAERIDEMFDLAGTAGCDQRHMAYRAHRFELFEVEGAAPLPDERRHPPADVKTHGNKHVAFRVDNLETFLSEMHAKGADIAFVVRESFGKGCFIRDCAGNLIEFVEEPDG